MKQWAGFVKPNFEKFVEPQKKNADVLIPRGLDNTIAISMQISLVSLFDTDQV